MRPAGSTGPRSAWSLRYGVPASPPCRLCGVYLIRQGCVHEHITEARACSLHLSMLLSYAPPEEWGCARCLPLQVPAPLIVTPSPFGGGS